MKRDDSVYLHHIMDAMLRIEVYVQGIDEDTFYERFLVQDGVIRQLEIVGEAVKHLSREVCERYDHIPWQDIAGMRDKLIHDYFGVDLETVWLTATEDIPAFRPEVAKMLEEIE